MQDAERHVAVASCIADGLAPEQGGGVEDAAAYLARHVCATRSADLQSAAVRYVAAMASDEAREGGRALSDAERAAAAAAVQRLAALEVEGGASAEVRAHAAEALLHSGRVQRARASVEAAVEACPKSAPLRCLALRIRAAQAVRSGEVEGLLVSDELALGRLSGEGAAQVVAEAAALAAAAGGDALEALLAMAVERMRASPEAAASMSDAAAAVHTSVWCGPSPLLSGTWRAVREWSGR